MSVRATSDSTDQLGTSPEDMNSKNNVSTSDSKDRLETSLEDKENNLSASATSNSKEQLETSQQNDDSSSQKGTTHRKYQAALKLQKVYKSFRTRRQLADCAILVEQRWWKVLDFAELRRSSISFFDIQKPETAVSRWARARTRAAKVGKGLSKDKKARKLALQHWLEAIDPRHRYGHNLHFYYAKWLHCDSKQPFFYWLDIGEGREVTHEGCPRSKLQTQCIKYLGPVERQAYEVVVVGRKLVYKQSGVIIDTTKSPKGTKWIFVLSVSKDLYVGQKSKGTFQHSSFLAGGATLSAGRLVAEDGILKSIWPHSGHYLPTEENFQEFMSFLIENNVDLTNVTKAPADDEDGGILSKKNSIRVRNSPRRADSSTTNALGTVEEGTDDSRILSDNAENIPLKSRLPEGLKAKIATLEIPDKDDVFDNFSEQPPMTCREYFIESESESEDGYETAEESVLTEEDFMVSKQNLFDDEEEHEEEHEEEEKTIAISKEKIMQRIDSHKGMNSYQLGQHLTTRWSTGAGPRIGCMRDYPAELQFRVLQQAYLSPRPGGKVMLPPSPLFKETTSAAVTLAAAPPKSRTRRQLTIG